ncbi:MAG TPA: glycosyltransferase family 1 protein [Candidatus Didemnitutus sp.]|nr:glycosyltransferase family 1 protein [Candidatus Didemnitutus sp.]
MPADRPGSPPHRRLFLHLALVTETYAPEINGVAMTLGRLVDGLAERGHRVTIIRPRQRHESPRFSVTHRLACRQVRLPGFPLPGYPQLRVGFPAGRRLRQLWQLNRPDLVHVATEGPLGASAITTAVHFGIPVTSSFHTNFDQYTRDYRVGWLRGIVAAWLRRVHNRTFRTFVPTRDLLDRLAAEGYANLRLLSRGVDTALFTPARRDPDLRAAWGVKPDDLVVLHVGRMAAEKNYPLLFRAFDALKTAEPRARLVLVGDGPMLATYQKQRPEAVFTGFYTGANLARHYASGDIYLHPSYTETFGNVVTEALGSGLAVSGFDYAAAHEFIRHEQNGLVAAPADEATFIANAVRLARDPALRLKLAQAGRETALQLSWERVITGFERDLLEVVAEHGGSAAPVPATATTPRHTLASSPAP